MIILISFIIGTLALSLKAGKDSMNEGIKNVHNSTPNLTQKTEKTLDCLMKKKVRLVVIFSVMMAVFVVSFLPFAVCRLMYDTGMFASWSSVDQFKLLSMCHIMYRISSLINPLLTLIMKEHYRNKVVELFGRVTGHSSKRRETQL